MTKLSERVNLKSGSDFEQPTDYTGIPLLLVSIGTYTGKFGEYAILKAKDENGNRHTFSTGAEAIMNVANSLVDRTTNKWYAESEDPDNQPLAFQFRKAGKALLIEDADFTPQWENVDLNDELDKIPF
jgi:hypothetical protein